MLPAAEDSGEPEEPPLPLRQRQPLFVAGECVSKAKDTVLILDQ